MHICGLLSGNIHPATLFKSEPTRAGQCLCHRSGPAPRAETDAPLGCEWERMYSRVQVGCHS